MIISYKSSKMLKARFDIEFDEEVEREESGAATTSTEGDLRPAAPRPPFLRSNSGPTTIDDESASLIKRRRAPQSVSQMLLTTPGRKSLIGKRRRFSTMVERTGAARQSDSRTTALLHFWVLFALIHLLACYGVIYAVELRAVIAIIGILPTQHGAPILNALFRNIAAPVLASYMPRLITWLRSQWYALIGIVSPFIRAALTHISHAAVRYAPTLDLLALESSVQGTQEELSLERRARRRAALTAPSPADFRPAAGGQMPLIFDGLESADTDFFENDEVAARRGAGHHTAGNKSGGDAMSVVSAGAR